MKIAWLTDTHFSLLSKPEKCAFFSLLLQACDALYFTGDIFTGESLAEDLELLAQEYSKPIYFVFGNHDYYKIFFNDAKKIVDKLQQKYSHLYYLTQEQAYFLSEEVALIGDDSWYDALWSEPMSHFVFLPDWYFIKDFRSLFGSAQRLKLVRDLAKEACNRVQSKLELSLQSHKTIYLLLHVPPWPPSNKSLLHKFWKPYNSSKLISDMLEQTMSRYPDKKLIVLSGHTHVQRYDKIADNIELKVGAAEFGSPQVQEFIFI